MCIIQFKSGKELVYLNLEQHFSWFDCCITYNPNYAFRFKTKDKAKDFLRKCTNNRFDCYDAKFAEKLKNGELTDIKFIEVNEDV